MMIVVIDDGGDEDDGNDSDDRGDSNDTWW